MSLKEFNEWVKDANQIHKSIEYDDSRKSFTKTLYDKGGKKVLTWESDDAPISIFDNVTIEQMATVYDEHKRPIAKFQFVVMYKDKIENKEPSGYRICVCGYTVGPMNSVCPDCGANVPPEV
jgi:hypothetical protein